VRDKPLLKDLIHTTNDNQRGIVTIVKKSYDKEAIPFCICFGYDNNVKCADFNR